MADRTVKVTINANVDNYLTGLQKAKSATQSMTDDAKARVEGQQKLFDAAGKGLLVFGGAAAAGVGLAIKAYADWDAKMAQVKSLSHAGSADMQSLSAQTFDFATKFGISASEAADAEIELTKGGVSVSDMVHGALSGALTLAAAGQMDVGDATSIAVSAMTQFHLKGQDVSHIADLLAAGADKALGSVSDLGQGLKYVGPVASSMGVSIEQTVGTLSELAQNGILADQAGTSLRGMLSSLTSPSQVAAQTMQQYGISVFNTQGKFIGFDGVAEQLKTHLGGLDQATRQYALGQIFGNQQVTAATVLMQGGAKAVDQWTSAVNDQGFAAEQASGKMDSLEGRWTKLNAALKNDLVQTGQGASGPLNAAVGEATKLVTAYGNLSQPMKTVVLDGTAGAAAIALFGGAAIVAVPKIVAFDAAIAAAGGPSSLMIGSLKSTATFIAGPWGAALGVGVTGAMLFNNALKVDSGTLQELEQQMISGKKNVDSYNEALKANTSSNLAQDVKFAVPNGLPFLVNGTRDLKQFLDIAGDGSSKIDTLTAKVMGLGTDGFLGTQQALKTLDQELADTADTSVPKAKQAFDQFVKTQQLTKAQQADVMAQLPKYSAALKDQKSSADGASSSSSNTASAIAQVADSATNASTDISELSNELKGLDNGQIDATNASIALQQAISDATTAVGKNGKTLDETTQKGRDNMSALTGIASAALNAASANATAGVSMTVAQKNMTSARAAFIKVATAMTGSATTANELANQLGLIPSSVTTAYETSGGSAAINTANAVKSAIASVPTSKTVQIKVSDPNGILTKLGDSTTVVARGSKTIARASGGILPGPPSSKDNMLIHAASGEFVTNAAATQRNLGALTYINSGGVIPGFANGGLIGRQFSNLARQFAIPHYAAGGQVQAPVASDVQRPVYLDGSIVAVLHETATGAAQLVFNQNMAQEARRASVGQRRQ